MSLGLLFSRFLAWRHKQEEDFYQDPKPLPEDEDDDEMPWDYTDDDEEDWKDPDLLEEDDEYDNEENDWE